MGFFSGGPACDLFAVFIKDGELCTRDLFLCDHVSLADLDLGIGILHVNLLDLSSLFDCELHIFGTQVTIRGKFLTEHIFTGFQHGNVMRMIR